MKIKEAIYYARKAHKKKKYTEYNNRKIISFYWTVVPGWYIAEFYYIKKNNEPSIRNKIIMPKRKHRHGDKNGV
jgi:hypothetical protein